MMIRLERIIIGVLDAALFAAILALALIFALDAWKNRRWPWK